MLISISERELATSPEVDWAWSSTTMSSVNSLSRSMSSATSSRKSRPRRVMASFLAFLTSAALDKMPAGFMNSLPEDAKRSLPWVKSSRKENLGYSGTVSHEMSGGVFG